MKTLLITFTILGLIFAVPAFTPKAMAQEAEEVITATDLGVAEPSTGFVGWLKNLGFTIQYGLTFNPVKKANMQLNQANQRLIEAQQFLLENPDKTQAQIQYQQALAKYENRMQKVESMTEKFKDKSATNPKIDQFMERFTDNVLKHQVIIDRMKNNVSGDKLQVLDKINENTIKTFGEIIKNIETPERFPDRFATIIDNRVGPDSKYLKGMEFLNWVDEVSRGDLKDTIQNSVDRTVTRAQAAWKNQDPEARTERFKEYLNEPGDPIIQLKVLDQLQNNPNFDPGLKSLIPAAKNDKIEKIDETVNALKNDEHRIRYFERVRTIEDPASKPLLQGLENRYNNPDAPGAQTRQERVQEEVKSDIQQQQTTDQELNPVQKDKDIRDSARTRQENKVNPQVEPVN